MARPLRRHFRAVTFPFLTDCHRWHFSCSSIFLRGVASVTSPLHVRFLSVGAPPFHVWCTSQYTSVTLQFHNRFKRTVTSVEHPLRIRSMRTVTSVTLPIHRRFTSVSSRSLADGCTRYTSVTHTASDHYTSVTQPFHNRYKSVSWKSLRRFWLLQASVCCKTGTSPFLADRYICFISVTHPFQ